VSCGAPEDTDFELSRGEKLESELTHQMRALREKSRVEAWPRGTRYPSGLELGLFGPFMQGGTFAGETIGSLTEAKPALYGTGFR
jgi:hypothetical protein